MSDAATINKLIVLYILNQLNVPINSSRLYDFVTNKLYMDYISLGQALSELVDAEFIKSIKQANRTEYIITPSGQQTINFFKSSISDSIKQEIRDFFKINSLVLKDETAVSSDYTRLPDGEYMLKCKITENGGPLLEIKLTVPTELQAQASAIKWQSKAQIVYANIMGELL